MKFISAFVLLAATLAGASRDTTTEATTTVTSTLTMTMTITHCGPEVADCPYSTPTPTPIEEEEEVEEVKETYPARNATAPVHTGGYRKNSTAPTLLTATSTDYVDSKPTAPVVVPEGGAGSLYVSSGMLLGVLAAGAALL